MYLDYNANWPITPESRQALIEALDAGGGNPNSGHSGAQRARDLLEGARRQLARSLSARPSEIVFTSGGTESNNLAITGLYEARAPRRKIVTVATEHPSVLGIAAHLAERGSELVMVPVDSAGQIDLSALQAELSDDVALCAVMRANNETGVLHDTAAIGALCHDAGVPLHCDAVQAVGKIPVVLPALGAQTAAFTAHKLGGPLGVGALWIAKGCTVSPRAVGGGQERGLRPGTQPFALAHAFARAVDRAVVGLDQMTGRVAALRDRLEAALRAAQPGVVVHGGDTHRLPNTSYVAFPGLDAAETMLWLDRAGFRVGTGAACGTRERTPSPVLTAMGCSPAQSQATLRFSLSTETTDETIDALLVALLARLE